MIRKNTCKTVLSAFLVLAIIIMTFPVVAFSASATIDDRVADASSMDSWKQFYGSQVTSTQYAGGVWMDKSVFTNASAFPEGTVSMDDPENAFLVALSAITSNKEIVGYSTLPTDTMLVLDLSDSMKDSIEELIASSNHVIQGLLDTNKNNRVGVVVYGGNLQKGASTYEQGTVLLLPLDRYTTQDEMYLYASGGTVGVDSDVRASDGLPPYAYNDNNEAYLPSKAVGGGSYLQAGIFEALKQFEAADPLVGSNNFQSGQKRLPVMVLMSDGAPTTATNYFDDVDKEHNVTVGWGRDQYTYSTSASTGGNGTVAHATDQLAFLTQLTASYTLNCMETHYDCVDEGLFYTLGLGIDRLGTDDTAAYHVAKSVLNPAESTAAIKAEWEEYLALLGNTTQELQVPSPVAENGTKAVSIYKNAAAVDRLYVDKYFEAADVTELSDTFTSVLEQILLQSRYYPTDLEGGNPDFGGYITFDDIIGDYMEVKDIKGILLGDTFFDGSAVAQKLNNHSEEGLGTVADPSTLGLEFRDSVMTRLGISEITVAIDLISKAYTAGQLSYNAQTGAYSNYIGWYANAAGTYEGFWDEKSEDLYPPTKDAIYKIKSYGFLGKAKGNLQDSDMMYMTVQVRTHIKTGEQDVLWKIPAALVPIVTYKVELEGTTEANAQNVQLTREAAEPIRLVYEVGLDDAVNELNVGTITDSRYVQKDGSRVFWTNKWDASATNSDDQLASIAGFTPSNQNERYYYTSDTLMYQMVGEDYVPVTDPSHVVDVNAAYYRTRYIFTQSDDTAVLYYEPIAPNSLEKAVWNTSFAVSDDITGGWIIPAGTVYHRQTDRYFPKESNPTGSLEFIYNLKRALINGSYEADSMLGNNGRLRVVPATGIKLSKMVDIVEPGALKDFRFRITLTGAYNLPVNGTFNTALAPLDGADGMKSKIKVVNGEAEVTLRKDQTLYITGLPAGTKYTVEELTDNTPYKAASVSVNGISDPDLIAAGVVSEYELDDIDFANTPRREGNLFITKSIEHPFGGDTTVPAHLSFEVTVRLEHDEVSVANQTYMLTNGDGEIEAVTTNENGELVTSIKPSQTIAIDNIPAGTTYTVIETQQPYDGFVLEENACKALSGHIAANGNVQATLVDRYEPNEIRPDEGEIVLELSKVFEGREWRDGDSFTFILEKLYPETNDATETVAVVTIDDEQELSKTIDMANEVYSALGTYHYRLSEIVADTDNGITYDTVYRRFHVDVTDHDWDGYLEIDRVSDVMNTVVTGDAQNGWKISADFTNLYAPHSGTIVEIPVKKVMASDNFYLNGFRFALFNVEDMTIVHEAPLTDLNGETAFHIAYAATDIGVHNYKMAEVSTDINGMTYSEMVYSVTVTVTDNGDGTISASYVITNDAVEDDPATVSDEALVEGTPVFENAYVSGDALLVLSGNKELTGRPHTTGEFAFELYETDETFSVDGLEPLQTVTNAYDGSFVFDTLTFDESGTYYLVVREKAGCLGGILYDDAMYTITVLVTDENGVRIVSHDLNEKITFCNSYDAQDVDVTLSGASVLDGRDLFDGEFTYVLTDADGEVVQTVQNNGTGFAFDTISYDTVGVYDYTITQQANEQGGIIYDHALYSVRVTVTDDGVGHLHSVVQYWKDGLASNEIVFHNAYDAAPLEMVFDGVKTLIGRAIENEEFMFVLDGARDGHPVLSTKVTADGTFCFEPVVVYSVGTYRFYIAEVNNRLDYITYDTTFYDVTVTVEDDGNGHLYEALRVISKDGAETAQKIVFTNVYDSPFATTTTSPSEMTTTTSPSVTTTASPSVTTTTSPSVTTTTSPSVTTTTSPSVDVPDTGEHADLVLWIAFLFVSGGVFVSLAVHGKKKDSKE